MRNTLIDSVINNFAGQHRVCEEMAGCASEQLALLKEPQKAGASAQVMDIMAKRQRLLDDLQLLDTENRKLQEQALSELGITEFTLSQLETRLEPEQFANFKEMLDKLGTILKSISETDRQNQLLMRDGLARVSKAGTRANNKEASSVYQQAAKFKKENL